MSDVISIPLSQGKLAVIDAEDFEKVRDFKWFAHRRRSLWYARRQSKGQTIHMHRVILSASSGVQVDHIDGNGLNNRRNNLRLCSRAENLRAFQHKRRNTTSKFRGVTFCKRDSVWEAGIERQGKKLYLGRFRIEEDAAHAYDKKARELFGEFASPNFQ